MSEKTEEARRLADLLDAECSYIDALGPAHVTTTRGYHANSRDMLLTLADEVERLEAAKDGAYLERNQVVAALSKCFPSVRTRTAIEGWSEDWHGCVYIELPTGQVSWHFHDSQAYLFDHLPQQRIEWDGHDTPEKYRRLAALDVAMKGKP